MAGGAEHKAFRNRMQAEQATFGVQPYKQDNKPVASTPNPVHNKQPGLGATTISHPFKSGKPRI